ncbi:hypothetical protein [Luteimonas sp. MC1572]|uniref:hypothetical protein n=1 Tax=Luteimonas sp. MC1572 TaxID=2799325 RepID=UPI0018F0EE3B|nr:hypothetical protein [Luteimonas sp. MC1572]MBJ6983018.1 hypothetical protein [Luteimonas sp. MC1572]QQO03239.1 hypothetical protein JGR64_00185 [Luteimonas sp. MC1572]
MDFLVPVALVVAVLAALMIYRRLAANGTTRQQNARLVERQKAIQSAIDKLGSTLKSGSTTIQQGDDAMRIARDALHQLDAQGDLSELIADNEQFFKEWRASRVSA